jgi:low affinity Fe/Cu permease
VDIDKKFAEFSSQIAKFSGRPLAFVLATAFVMTWAVTGPVFHFSDTWQLVMNTVSSIITFVMVFLIQNTQARDSEAIQAKLDELVRAIEPADNRYIALEKKTDREIENFRERHGPKPAARQSRRLRGLREKRAR